VIVKICRKFLWFELATVTSQALKHDVLNFCQQFYAMFYKPSTTPIILHPIYLHNADLSTSV